VEGVPTEEPRPDASNARSQRPATRAIGVFRALVCVLLETPVVAHRCFALPRSDNGPVGKAYMRSGIHSSTADKLLR
jgi:hypothetical protein